MSSAGIVLADDARYPDINFDSSIDTTDLEIFRNQRLSSRTYNCFGD